MRLPHIWPYHAFVIKYATILRGHAGALPWSRVPICAEADRTRNNLARNNIAWNGRGATMMHGRALARIGVRNNIACAVLMAQDCCAQQKDRGGVPGGAGSAARVINSANLPFSRRFLHKGRRRSPKEMPIPIDFPGKYAKSLIMAQDEGKLGPAMTRLTPRQRAFVYAVLAMPISNNKRAAAEAGFKGDDNTLAVTGHRLAHDENVLAAIQEESLRRVRSSVALGASHLVTIMAGGPNISTKDQLRAIEMAFNRSGMHAITEHKVDVTHSLSEPEKLERARLLAVQMGIDPVKLLGHLKAPQDAKEVVDAEFSVVEPQEDWG